MDLVKISNKIPSMSESDIMLAVEAEKTICDLEQLPLVTYHTIHGGIYTRTIHLKAGDMAIGVIIKIPTTMVISGHLNIYIGDSVQELKGVNIFTASANRKQMAVAVEDTVFVMCFKTDAKTVEEAEEEFTDEASRLMSRVNRNEINITGE